MLRTRVPRRDGAAFTLAQQKNLTAYWVPKIAQTLKIPDTTGHGWDAAYSGGASGAQGITDLPPSVRVLGSGAQTAQLAAVFPTVFTIMLFAKAQAAITYLFGFQSNGVLIAEFLRLQPAAQLGYVIDTSGAGNFVQGVSTNPVEGTWHSIGLVSTGVQCRLFVDGNFAANVVKVPRADPKLSANLGLNYGGTLGVGLLYLGTALSDAEIAKNHNTLKLKHGYP